jgi:hypothetical protein
MERGNRTPEATAGKTPPLDSRIWADPRTGESFKRYTCHICGRFCATWASFREHIIAHRSGITLDPERPILEAEEEEAA